MKLLIDDANLENIKRISEYYPIDGVSCNPTILKKAGKDPYSQLKEIRTFIGQDKDFHVQVVNTEANLMVQEGIKIAEVFGKDTYIKIPVNEEGLKAIKVLSSMGYNVTGTAIYSALQGFLAAKAGAKVVAPYVNRMDVLGYDGLKVANDINIMIKNAGLNSGIVGASLKNATQVIELYKMGVSGVTFSVDLYNGILKNQIIDSAIDAFVSDFESLVGKGKTMLDL